MFRQLQELGANFRLTARANQAMLPRQIRSQFLRKRKILFSAMDHEISHGLDITQALRAKQAPEHIRKSWIGTSRIGVVAAESRPRPLEWCKTRGPIPLIRV